MSKRKPGSLLPLEVSILQTGFALQSAEGSFYGFSLARALAGEQESALLSHGTLYKALSRLTTSGLLSAQWEPPEVAEGAGRPRRRLYTVTAEGRLAAARAESESAPAVAAAWIAQPTTRPGAQA